MANQSPDRRRVLEMLAKAAVAAQFPGFSRWVFAGQENVAPTRAVYQPRFFTAEEYQKLEVLTEMIIPADETPGAKDAGVSEFIDFMAAHGEESLPALRAGLQSLHGDFVALTPVEQEAILRGMQGQPFFELLRRYTVMGFYTSRIGLEELQFPGLRMYSESPECPHKDDPEHRHLPPARI
jgi:hypothetical protein